MQQKLRLLNLELELDFKMKKIIYILGLILVVSCNSDSAWDCIQTDGEIVQVDVAITSFERILVNRDVELIIKQGPIYLATIESGENLINDIVVIVVGNQLQITNNNSCNYVREYGITKVFITAPNIAEIRSSSQYEISSDGLLNYSILKLISENFSNPDSFTVGDFRLELNSINVQIDSNGLSSFYLMGQTQNLVVGFFAGVGRFEGGNFIAQNVEIFHRGANDMIVNPQLSLVGELRGAGNLISVSEPPLVDIQQFYTGQLIFQD